MTTVQSHVILALQNLKMVPSNVRKKKRVQPNVAKVLLYVMLVLLNVIMEPSNARKKNKGTIKCEKNIVTYDVGAAQIPM